MHLPTTEESPHFRTVVILALHALLVAGFLFGAFRVLIGLESTVSKIDATEQRIIDLHAEVVNKGLAPYTVHDHVLWCQQFQKLNPQLSVPIPPEE